MIRTRVLAALVLGLLALSAAGAAAPARGPAQAGAPDRLQWFREAKFGLFIHWGVYAMIGREEWARQLLQIPLAEYQRYADEFDPAGFDPDEWAALAREAGVRYVIITSKHHDGFALFDSAFTDYDVGHAKYGRDILGPLAASMRKAGLPLGFYYSIMDWHHPDYLPRRDWEKDRPAAGADFGRYLDYAQNQLRELVTKYDPAVLWFDGEWEHSNEEQRAFAIGRMLLEMKPSLLINDRLWRREPGYGDFGTPENFVPATGLRGPDGQPRLWEACVTMNWNGWGYNRAETEFHSAGQLIRQLVEIVSKGGNLLLNVGPGPDGRIQEEFTARLRRIGEWLRTNGEAIYGTTASVFERLPFFGRATVKGETLYIHVMGWPNDGTIVLPGLKTGVRRACLLADRSKALKVRRDGANVVVSLPARAADPDVTVVALELDGPPVVEPRPLGAGADGRIELPVYAADLQSVMGQRAYLDHFYRTTMLTNWQNVNDYPEWKFETSKPGTYEVLASYASMWGGQASYEVEIDGRKLAAKTESSPSVYFPATFRVGRAILPAGEHTLRVRITAVVNNHAMNLEKVVLVPSAP
ncbi:MAG TPA: alpha-L-fucosidase [Candidatus Aminicenantes bacterium]|nr:alpha-L-fucosidase [Candidatus Aminicenantes bacterium]HRY66342.1 alpha-L-fucosidase [Candidatus Aminicenantes bacterium]HRZ73269.1 alpha-L-fucosidase [Candidatus Aminicenantes bacterium]